MGTYNKTLITLWGLKNTFKQRQVPTKHKTYDCMYICKCMLVCSYVHCVYVARARSYVFVRYKCLLECAHARMGASA